MVVVLAVAAAAAAVVVVRRSHDETKNPSCAIPLDLY